MEKDRAHRMVLADKASLPQEVTVVAFFDLPAGTTPCKNKASR